MCREKIQAACGELWIDDRRAFFRRKSVPMTGGKRTELKLSDGDAQQPQRGVPNCCGHAAHLAGLAFGEFEGEPAVGIVFAETNRGLARRQLGLWIEQPHAARKCWAALERDATRELFQRSPGRDAFDLRPVRAAVSVLRMEET